MPKTVAIPDNTHHKVSEKQLEIRKKYGINLKLSYIISSILDNYLDKLEDVMRRGLNAKQDKEEDKEKKIEGKNINIENESAAINAGGSGGESGNITINRIRGESSSDKEAVQ